MHLFKTCISLQTRHCSAFFAKTGQTKDMKMTKTIKEILKLSDLLYINMKQKQKEK